MKYIFYRIILVNGKNKRVYKGEKIADIKVQSSDKIKSINC